MARSESIVIVFAKNAQKGAAKTRLARSIGDDSALEVYKILLSHTKSELLKLKQDIRIVFYGEIDKYNFWYEHIFQKSLQSEGDLGLKMQTAFESCFDEGYSKAVIIGTDLHDFSKDMVEEALGHLDNHDVVIGPAMDGGYYLLALKPNFPRALFENKQWSSSSVLEDTLNDLKHLKVQLLAPKNDIDTLADIVDIEEFKQFIV